MTNTDLIATILAVIGCFAFFFGIFIAGGWIEERDPLAVFSRHPKPSPKHQGKTSMRR